MTARKKPPSRAASGGRASAADARPGRSRPPRSGRARTRRESDQDTARRARAILERLAREHPEATCALTYADPYQLLMATILSAQCTDQRVNQVTPALFARYPTPAELAAAHPPELEEIIRSTGFFRAKARSLIGCAQALVRGHAGRVPARMADLVPLPGIGRKTANVVLGHAFDVAEGIAVDTHVLRVSARLGLTDGDDPIAVERRLMALVPRAWWTRYTDLVIFHGRKVCDARRPACGQCALFDLCRWPERQAHALPAAPAAARRRR